MPEVNSIRISISETSRLFGVDQKTIRRAIKAQEMRYIIVRGRYKINLESAIKWSQKKPTIRNKSNKYGLGQYVDKWKINNKHYSPNPKGLVNNQ
jgi:excisionase family DNA binding protein